MKPEEIARDGTKSFEKVESEFREGMALKKCRQCGCMKEELEQTIALAQAPRGLKDAAAGWLKEMDPIRYACLGCDYCYPAVAADALSTVLPHQIQGPACAMETSSEKWPPVAGEYMIGDLTGAVAISTLGSPDLAERIVQAGIPGVCIAGKTETENIGIDKVIKNTISNPGLRFLVLVGVDPKGHLPGATLMALCENGIDEHQRIIGSPGKRPFLRNVTREEAETFRKQIRIVNRIGIFETAEIASAVSDICKETPNKTCCVSATPKIASISKVEVVPAEKPETIEMDRAGYLVIIPDRAAKAILVEHYSYEDRLLRIIKGADARSIYWTIISNGWVSQLSHAAYLGKELAKAELAINLGLPYVQDGA